MKKILTNPKADRQPSILGAFKEFYRMLLIRVEQKKIIQQSLNPAFKTR